MTYSTDTAPQPAIRDSVSSEATIEIRGLVKHYDNTTVVDHVDLTVFNGEIFGILGPNGAGKTTTLEMVEGLRKPDEGSIHVAGIDAVRDPVAVKRIIGVQLQTTALFDFLSVRELIGLFASLYGGDASRNRIDTLIHLVSLEEKGDSRVETLSGGQQQRLSIALAMVNNPSIIFLDEPTTGLDPQARRNLWDVIRDIRQEGKTIVLTTHYMEEAEILCDRVAVMDAGRIIACDTPRNLIDGLRSSSTVHARLSDSGITEDDLARLEGVTSAKFHNGQIEIQTDDVQATIVALLALVRLHDAHLENLSTTNATLEDVFLYYTGRSLRQ